jgi:hypothetical protein
MTNKRIKLPKEGIQGPDQDQKTPGFIDADVEGHGFVNPAPPSMAPRSPSQGGDAVPADDDEDSWKGLHDR